MDENIQCLSGLHSNLQYLSAIPEGLRNLASEPFPSVTHRRSSLSVCWNFYFVWFDQIRGQQSPWNETKELVSSEEHRPSVKWKEGNKSLHSEQ
jgi:hypothetical protein